MTSPSFRDMENLSAFLDGQLSRSERTRLEKRLQSDAVLAAALQELRQTRALLQRTPKRRAPRSFTLTPRMAGVRPPVPRLVPVFAWASAVAMVLFIFTLGTSLVGQLSTGTAAPMLAAAPSGFGGGPPAAASVAPLNPAPATMIPANPAFATFTPTYPALAIIAPTNTASATITPTNPAPAIIASANSASATNTPTCPESGTKAYVSQGTENQTELATPTEQALTTSTPEATPTEQALIMPASEATLPSENNGIQPSSAPRALQKTPNPWLFIWPGLGVLLGALALLVWWLNQRAFQRKNSRG